MNKWCRSREGAWIEITSTQERSSKCIRRSREGAWIEIKPPTYKYSSLSGRSREGAWIEISAKVWSAREGCVAPARERGLKLLHADTAAHVTWSLPRGSVD